LKIYGGTWSFERLFWYEMRIPLRTLRTGLSNTGIRSISIHIVIELSGFYIIYVLVIHTIVQSKIIIIIGQSGHFKSG
jgi:hypothetical protein